MGGGGGGWRIFMPNDFFFINISLVSIILGQCINTLKVI